MPTTRKPWPPAANAARHKAISNTERIARLARRGTELPSVQADPRAEALFSQIWALAEEARRELGEARAGE